MPDPFNVTPPPDQPPCYFTHPDFWPVPTAFAIAPGAFGQAILDGTPTALAGIAKAVDRLSQHCDLIVGGCGYMYAARSLVRSDTPTLLSGLQLLPNALDSTRLPIGVLTYNRASTEKMLGSRPDLSRLRIVGVDHLPNWSMFARPDLVTNWQVNPEQLRAEILELCLQERHDGAFAEIGSLVLECTAMPQFRMDLTRTLRLPIWDIAAVARSLLGA
ncbi:hypothetical protein [Bradyrhizobium sp. DASA03007]|uniref:hypothetical protein n=1 Tax=unclassified Bradyrhizobium TaxID=2631580 RepID=UPI003F717BDD